jgi:hypothetical protein
MNGKSRMLFKLWTQLLYSLPLKSATFDVVTQINTCGLTSMYDGPSLNPNSNDSGNISSLSLCVNLMSNILLFSSVKRVREIRIHRVPISIHALRRHAHKRNNKKSDNLCQS